MVSRGKENESLTVRDFRKEKEHREEETSLRSRRIGLKNSLKGNHQESHKQWVIPTKPSNQQVIKEQYLNRIVVGKV